MGRRMTGRQEARQGGERCCIERESFHPSSVSSVSCLSPSLARSLRMSGQRHGNIASDEVAEWRRGGRRLFRLQRCKWVCFCPCLFLLFCFPAEMQSVTLNQSSWALQVAGVSIYIKNSIKTFQIPSLCKRDSDRDVCVSVFVYVCAFLSLSLFLACISFF